MDLVPVEANSLVRELLLENNEYQAVFFPQGQWMYVGFPLGWNSYLGISHWRAVNIKLNGRMVGEVDGHFPWDLPLNKSINRF